MRTDRSSSSFFTYISYLRVIGDQYCPFLALFSTDLVLTIEHPAQKRSKKRTERYEKKMLILKVHYFLWFGSLSGILPYASVFGERHASATATQIGLLYTILPFVAMLAKPIGCACADRFSAHKLVLVSFLILTLVGFGSLILVPWLGRASSWTWWFFCAAVLLANTSMGIVISMTDSLVMRDVSIGRSSFGSVRVFGTLGYGILG